MPRTTFDEKNKAVDSASFPKLTLQKGEQARIVVIEDSPVFEYVHQLRAPQVINGKVVMETYQPQNGDAIERPAMDFFGKPICVGDYGIVADKGFDADNCPACRGSQEYEFIPPPERRFAGHVLRYSTLPGSFNLATPFSLHVLVWAYTERVFGKLIDLQSEWGKLQDHDLLLGPCTNQKFQNFEFAISGQAAWKSSPETVQFTVETFRNNQCPDLSAFCGRKADRIFIQSDVDRVIARNAQAFGGVADAVPVDAAVQIDLNDLLSQSTDTAIPHPAPQPGPDLSALVAPETHVAPTVVPAQEALPIPSPAPQPAPAEVAAAPQPVLFDPNAATVPVPEPQVVAAPAPAPQPEPQPVPAPAAQPVAQATSVAPVPEPAVAAPTPAPAPTDHVDFKDLMAQLTDQA